MSSYNNCAKLELYKYTGRKARSSTIIVAGAHTIYRRTIGVRIVRVCSNTFPSIYARTFLRLYVSLFVQPHFNWITARSQCLRNGRGLETRRLWRMHAHGIFVPAIIFRAMRCPAVIIIYHPPSREFYFFPPARPARRALYVYNTHSFIVTFDLRRRVMFVYIRCSPTVVGAYNVTAFVFQTPSTIGHRIRTYTYSNTVHRARATLSSPHKCGVHFMAVDSNRFSTLSPPREFDFFFVLIKNCTTRGWTIFAL